MVDYEKLLNYALRLLIKKRYSAEEVRRKISSLLEKKKWGRGVAEEGLEISETEGKDGFIQAKIASLEDNQTLTDKIIKRLEELNYINDEQFVADYISDRTRFKPRGRYLLIQELKKRGITEEIVLGFLNKTGLDEKQMALKLLEKKSDQWQSLDMKKKKEKACRLLISKGFNADTVYKAIDCWYNPDALE